MADANPELTEFNRRVLRWAKAFDRKYRDAALVIGWAAYKDTHQTLRIKWPTLVGLSRKHAREGRMDKPVAERTLQRHVAEMETLGIVKVSRGKQGFADKRRGMQAANVYWIDFTKVIAGGRAADHDFWAPLEDDYSPRTGEQETVIGEQVGEQVGTVSSSSSSSNPTKEKDSPPAAGRSRVPFTHPAFRPSAATEKNPSVDARLTGSAELDSIKAAFPEPVEQEMASEFVKALRDYDSRQVVRAARFWFKENSYVLGRGIANPRAYARKCAGSVRETLDGWKAEDERNRRYRESVRREAVAQRAAEEQRQREEAEQEARGMVRITALTADDWDAPGWLPRDRADQVPGPSGGLVWRPRKRRPDEIDWAAIRAGIDLGEDSPGLTDTDSGKLTDGTAPRPGINIDELLGEGSEDEPDTGRR